MSRTWRRTVLYMASLPLEANAQFVTVMATKMPYHRAGLNAHRQFPSSGSRGRGRTAIPSSISAFASSAVASP